MLGQSVGTVYLEEPACGGDSYDKSASRWRAANYYQLLSERAAIRSFLHKRTAGPQRLESSKSWWCNCGKRQTRHHLLLSVAPGLLGSGVCGRGSEWIAIGNIRGHRQ